MKIFLGRQSLLGDIVTYLPVLDLVEKLYPKSYKLFSLAKKCAQILPLLANQPLIDKIQISEPSEGLGQGDIKLKDSCDLFIEVNPQHKELDWYNYRHMIEENFHMIDMDYNQLDYSKRIPKLVPWFDLHPVKSHIAFWPCAGYGRENRRHPSKEWYSGFIPALQERTGAVIVQFGSMADYHFGTLYCSGFVDLRELSFFDQVKATLNCRLMIGTDSGSSLIMAAYGFPQVSLITNHNLNHHSNLSALAPRNLNNINVFHPNGFEDLDPEIVIRAVEMLYR